MVALFQAPRDNHGTSLDAAESIARNGFRVWFQDDEIGRYASGGNLGTGIYVTSSWRIALWFGTTLLRVAFRPGTKLLNSALPHDDKTIEYLRREFGREILRKAPWKVLPRNKKLKRGELIALFRYHYRQAWGKEGGFAKPVRRQEFHSRLLGDFKNMLIRYGYHGFGNPKDDNGIVVFAEDRLVLTEVVAEMPSSSYSTLQESDFCQFGDISEVKQFFTRCGSRRAKELAERVAAKDVAKSPG